MKVKAYGITDIGLERQNNEDFFFSDEEKGIFIVCDGIGGNKAGEIASKMAVETVVRRINEEYSYLEACRQGKMNDDQIFKFSADIIREACKVVYEMGNNNPKYSKMGTTLTMAITMSRRVLICNVGDSRAYLISGNGVHQISEDHTMAREFFKKGLIKSELDAPPYIDNVLTRSLGKYESVEVDCVLIPVIEEDRIVLCTDGISGYFQYGNQLGEIIEGLTPEKAGDALIKFALKNRARDNATAIVIDINSENYLSDYEYLEESLIMEVFSDCSIFTGLTYSQLSRMRTHMELVQLSKNETLVEQGELYNGLFLIIDGGILSGDELLTRGEGIGVRALYQKQKSQNVKIAVRHTRLLFFSRKSFKSFSQRYSIIGYAILQNILNIIEYSKNTIVTKGKDIQD